MSSGATVAGTQLKLLDRFDVVRNDESLELPDSVQRVVAFVALRGSPQRRSTVAGVLWPETGDDHAAANLRTALWRLKRSGAGVLDGSRGLLTIPSSVDTDLDAIVRAMRSINDDPDFDVRTLDVATRQLGGELLPDWHDDWILFERERLRQLRLHALETLCERFSRHGRHLAAIEAGLLAVSSDPIRESAHRALIVAHLAEGNVAEALRQYKSCASQLEEALGVAPTPSLRALVAPWLVRRRRTARFRRTPVSAGRVRPPSAENTASR